MTNLPEVPNASQESKDSAYASMSSPVSQNAAKDKEPQGQITIWEDGKALFVRYLSIATVVLCAVGVVLSAWKGMEPVVILIALGLTMSIIVVVVARLCLSQKSLHINWDAQTLAIGKDAPRSFSEVKYFRSLPDDGNVKLQIGFDSKNRSQRVLSSVAKAAPYELETIEKLIEKSGLESGTLGDNFNPKKPWLKDDALQLMRIVSGKETYNA